MLESRVYLTTLLAKNFDNDDVSGITRDRIFKMSVARSRVYGHRHGRN